MTEVNYLLVLLASFIAVASPGPATLAIAGTSMQHGRRSGAMLALGISTGSLFWSVSAALGISALMVSQAWLMDWVRYVGASYLLYLGWKSARSAIRGQDKATPDLSTKKSGRNLYIKGVAIHLTNPKAILFFGSLYSVAVPVGTAFAEIALLNFLIVGQGFVVFQAYAYLFAKPIIRNSYFKLSRWFDGTFAVLFGGAAMGIITAKLQ